MLKKCTIESIILKDLVYFTDRRSGKKAATITCEVIAGDYELLLDFNKGTLGYLLRDTLDRRDRWQAQILADFYDPASADIKQLQKDIDNVMLPKLKDVDVVVSVNHEDEATSLMSYDFAEKQGFEIE